MEYLRCCQKPENIPGRDAWANTQLICGRFPKKLTIIVLAVSIGILLLVVAISVPLTVTAGAPATGARTGKLESNTGPEWTEWGACSKCGNGTRTRQLNCSTTTEPCNSSALQTEGCYISCQVMSFPRRSDQDRVEHVTPDDTSLTAFTISLWVQANISGGYHTPFSYATSYEDNEITMHLATTYTELVIGDIPSRDPSSVVDGQWHHVGVTWENTFGVYRLYIDGEEVGAHQPVSRNRIIQQGALILGQEQDSYKGGFDSVQSFQGNLSSLNIWDRVLNGSDVADFARKCPTDEGNFTSWSTLKTALSSGVSLIYSSYCA